MLCTAHNTATAATATTVRVTAAATVAEENIDPRGEHGKARRDVTWQPLQNMEVNKHFNARQCPAKMPTLFHVIEESEQTASVRCTETWAASRQEPTLM
jgi:hypothetical protein